MPKELAGPSLEFSFTVEVPGLDTREEVRKFVGRVGERIRSRKLLDLKVGSIRGGVIKANVAFEA
jgi:hypothetical protein